MSFPSRTWLRRLAALPLLVAACAGQDGNPVGPTFTVGPDGGMVEFLNGAVRATFPAGAVDSNVTFSVSTASLPSAPTLIPGTAIAMSPAGYELNLPATIDIKVDPDIIPAGSGILPGELRLYRYLNGVWSMVSESSFDSDTEIITGSVGELATYAIMGIPVGSVIVSPSQASVAVGGTTDLDVLTSGDGIDLPNRPTFWSSLGTGIATVNGSGTVTGVTEGVTSITARSGERADTVSVQVHPATPPGPFNEPAGYIAIVDRAFNSKAADDPDRGTGSFPQKTGGSEGFDGIEYRQSALTIQEDASAPLSAPNVMRAAYPAGVIADGTTYAPGPFQTQGFTSSVHGSKEYRELYFRTAFKVSPNWQGHPTGVSPKLLYIRSTGEPSRAEPYLLLDGNAGDLRLTVNLQGSPLDPRNELRGLPANTAAAASTPINDMQRGIWYVVEVQLVLNTPGNANGTLRIWLDGVKTHEYTDIRFLPGASQLYWSNGHFNSTWGGQGGTINETMYLYWDHAYFSGRP